MFLFAINSFVSKKTSFDGSIMMILTSDEEGPAINGIRKLVDEELEKYEIDMCLVGEPSCKKILGDTIKNGRRGSLSGKLIVNGIQGHIAYPMNAENPIHTSSLAINENRALVSELKFLLFESFVKYFSAAASDIITKLIKSSSFNSL